MKLFKNAVALLMVLCMLACMSATGFAVNAGSYSVDYVKSEDGKTLTATVYAHNYIGLCSGSIGVNYTGGVKFDHYTAGVQAKKAAVDAAGLSWNNTVIYGFFFSEQLWDRDTYDNLMHAKIDVQDFDIVTFTFKLDGSVYNINIGISSKSYDGDNYFFSNEYTGAVTKTETNNSYYYLLKGDVNGDGKVGSDDARLALRASVNLEQYDPSSAQFYAADVNDDGKIGSDDARSILRTSVRLEGRVYIGDIDLYGKTVIGFDPLTGKGIVGVDKNGYPIYSKDPGWDYN